MHNPAIFSGFVKVKTGDTLETIVTLKTYIEPFTYLNSIFRGRRYKGRKKYFLGRGSRGTRVYVSLPPSTFKSRGNRAD